jgi:hypothetical protein
MSSRIGVILCLKGTESGSMFSILKTESQERRFNCTYPFQMLHIFASRPRYAYIGRFHKKSTNFCFVLLPESAA